MDHPVTFARHFARLLWLVLEEPGNIDEQKASLRALVTVSREGPVTLAAADGGVRTNGAASAPMVAGMGALATRMTEHGVLELVAHAGAAPGDLLAAAQLLAGSRDLGRPAGERLLDTGATTVRFIDHPGPVAIGLGDFDLVPDEVIATAVGQGRPRSAAMLSPADAGGLPGGADHFAAVQLPGGLDGLIAELIAAGDDQVLDVLERVATAAGAVQRDGGAADLLKLLVAVIRREEAAGPDTRRYVAMALRRMVSSHALRLIAALLPRRVVPREDIALALTRTGAEGADAVIEMLTQAQSATDRRAYFDMLLTMRAAIPALTHMLGDDRWYVVRNGAELLGEMGVVDAERSVTSLLNHEDERVRGSALSALLRFDTPASRAAVQGVLESSDPSARQQAVGAIGARRAPGASATLLRALDGEGDASVQRAIYAALGKVASASAVQRLVEAAEPASGIFKRKSPVQRAAATLALGDARTPDALAALRALSGDREREVREAAQRALANANRTGPEVTSVFAPPPRV